MTKSHFRVSAGEPDFAQQNRTHHEIKEDPCGLILFRDTRGGGREPVGFVSLGDERERKTCFSFSEATPREKVLRSKT